MNERSCLVVEQAGLFQNSVTMSPRQEGQQQPCLNSPRWKERDFSLETFQITGEEQKKVIGPPCQFPTNNLSHNQGAILAGKRLVLRGLHACFMSMSDEKGSDELQGFQGERSIDLWISIR